MKISHKWLICIDSGGRGSVEENKLIYFDDDYSFDLPQEMDVSAQEKEIVLDFILIVMASFPKAGPISRACHIGRSTSDPNKLQSFTFFPQGHAIRTVE